MLEAAAHLAPLTQADFPLVAELGARIWRSHYASMVPPAQIEYMLQGRYIPERLQNYLDSDRCWMELLWVEGRAVGYCSYALTERPGQMKLEQLYLLAELRGQGLGGGMLDHVEAQARARGCDSLLLQVNKKNAGSIAVYRARGFKVEEEAVFEIGQGFVMDDYVMVKAL